MLDPNDFAFFWLSFLSIASVINKMTTDVRKVLAGGDTVSVQNFWHVMLELGARLVSPHSEAMKAWAETHGEIAASELLSSFMRMRNREFDQLPAAMRQVFIYRAAREGIARLIPEIIERMRHGQPNNAADILGLLVDYPVPVFMIPPVNVISGVEEWLGRQTEVLEALPELIASAQVVFDPKL